MELVAVVNSLAPTLGDTLAMVPEPVRWLEVRADLVGDIEPDRVRKHFRGQLLYTLRSSAEGGACHDSEKTRLHRLRWAAQRYDLVDLEGERDLLPELMDAILPEKRLISWQGLPADTTQFHEQFRKLSNAEARFYKLVSTGDQPCHWLAPLTFLKSLGRSDTVAYSVGKAAFWNRVVAPRFGAPMVFGGLSKSGESNGEPTISQLIEDYGLPLLGHLEELCGIVGNPAHHSLSPRLHNAAYRALGRPALYVHFQVESFTEFWHSMVEKGTLESIGMSLRGLTVASPYKEEACLRATRVSNALVHRAWSSNLLVRTNGDLTADTTDPEGVLLSLRARGIQAKGKKTAVVGCGGAGRAVAAALDQAGAEVTLVNRSRERGLFAAYLLKLPFVPLSQFSVRGFSIVVHATPVGRDNDDLPFEIDELSAGGVVVDLAYGPQPTSLVVKSRALGHVTIDGRDVLLVQVVRQFQVITGTDMPAHLAREIIGRGVGAHNNATQE